MNNFKWIFRFGIIDGIYFRQNKVPNEKSKAKIDSGFNEFNVTLSATFNKSFWHDTNMANSVISIQVIH
jgi:hypothetical protein